MWQVGEKVSGGPLSACTRAPNKKTHQNATIKKMSHSVNDTIKHASGKQEK
jgi:hypothetical protein